MNTIQAKRDVLVYEYTWPNLLSLISKTKMLIHCPPFLKLVDYPEKTGLDIRVQLELRPITDLGLYARKANMFEILWFAISNLEIIRKFGPIDGYDPFVEKTAKEIQVRMTIPCVKMTITGLDLSLTRWDRRREARHTLVVTHFSELQF